MFSRKKRKKGKSWICCDHTYSIELAAVYRNLLMEELTHCRGVSVTLRKEEELFYFETVAWPSVDSTDPLFQLTPSPGLQPSQQISNNFHYIQPPTHPSAPKTKSYGSLLKKKNNPGVLQNFNDSRSKIKACLETSRYLYITFHITPAY